MGTHVDREATSSFFCIGLRVAICIASTLPYIHLPPPLLYCIRFDECHTNQHASTVQKQLQHMYSISVLKLRAQVDSRRIESNRLVRHALAADARTSARRQRDTGDGSHRIAEPAFCLRLSGFARATAAAAAQAPGGAERHSTAPTTSYYFRVTAFPNVLARVRVRQLLLGGAPAARSLAKAADCRCIALTQRERITARSACGSRTRVPGAPAAGRVKVAPLLPSPLHSSILLHRAAETKVIS